MTATRMVFASLVLALAATPALASDNSKSNVDPTALVTDGPSPSDPTSNNGPTDDNSNPPTPPIPLGSAKRSNTPQEVTSTTNGLASPVLGRAVAVPGAQQVTSTGPGPTMTVDDQTNNVYAASQMFSYLSGMLNLGPVPQVPAYTTTIQFPNGTSTTTVVSSNGKDFSTLTYHTVTNPDGSQTTTVTLADGSVTTFSIGADGQVTITSTNPALNTDSWNPNGPRNPGDFMSNGSADQDNGLGSAVRGPGAGPGSGVTSAPPNNGPPNNGAGAGDGDTDGAV